jgi:quinoprotein glucose dehydrogenase
MAFLVAAIAGLLTIPVTADRREKWWSDYGGGPDSSHYVNLDQIDKSNVSQLEVAWYYPHGASGFNPVAVGDVLYVLGRNAAALIALDANTGKELWIHEGLNGITNRGINYWQSADGKDRRLLFSINSYLQAIDARTGKSIMTFGKNGLVDLREGLARAGNRVQSRTPGKIWKNLIILGSSPGEAWMSPPGDIRAYDVVTGKRVWQFHTVPGPGEYGYDTWPKEAYKYAGGANAWGELSVDDARGIVYVPTGSGTYDFYGADRKGDNLFANCLLALDARTGKRLWHFQTVHHDLWDLDNVSAPQLVTVQHDGRRVDAVAHAGKTGFLNVFDRVSGKPLWPIEERPVPQSDVPGEHTSPTQPWPTKPEPFARMTFTVDDVNPHLLTPEQFAAMKDRVLKARNDGPFTPPTLNRDAVSMPGNQGGSNWGTTAANPKKGLVFVVNVNQVALLKLEDVKTKAGGQRGPNQGLQVYQQYCAACHGNDLRGVQGLPVPSLLGVTDRMAEDAIRAIITGGRGTMRPIPGITDQQISQLLLLLANPPGQPRRFGRSAAMGPLPPGPVVASGGAPLPPAPAIDPDPPSYGTNGGNGGNVPYPADVDVPTNRYVTEYGVLASATKPPYTTLTAYDLNTGTIKWQIAPGDDPATVERGGPRGTGAIGARHGIVTTASGLVFLICGDGHLRAYDEDTGKELWAGKLPGSASGIPLSYESKGRQYLVVGTIPGGRANAAPAPAPAADGPRGYIAFALPTKAVETKQ